MTKCSMMIMSTCLDAAHDKIKYTFKSTYKLDWLIGPGRFSVIWNKKKSFSFTFYKCAP